MIIFDLHTDISSFAINSNKFNFFNKNKLNGENFPNQIDYKRLKKGKVKFLLANICPIIASNKEFTIPDDPLLETLKQYSFYQTILNNNKLKIVDKFEQNKKYVSVKISIEGAYFIKSRKDLNLIPRLRDMGVISISPTWNYSNELGTGAKDENSKKGLSRLGIQFIKKCEESGILVDAVHSSRKTFDDIVKYSTKPVFVSHSASYEINPHRRNLTEEQMIKISKSGGIIGICFIQDFLGGNTIENAVEHLKNMIEIAGENHISIGGDFDGMSWNNLVTNLEDIGKIQNFVYECEKAGINKETLEKIAWKNAYNFFNSNT